MSSKGVSRDEALAGISLRARDAVAHSAAGSWWRRWWFSITPAMLVGVFTVVSLSLSLTFTVQLAWRSQVQLTESARDRLHALQVEERVQALLSAVGAAEVDLREHLATRSDAHLAALAENRARAAGHLAELRALLADRPALEEPLAQLERLVGLRFELMDRMAASARADAGANLLPLMLADRGYEASHALRVSTASILTQLRQELLERQAVLGGRMWRALGWLSAFVLLNVVAVAGVITVIHRAGRSSRIAKVCAWSGTIEYEGKWMSFEQYLEARFGIKASHGISPEQAAKMKASMMPPGG